MEAHFLTGFLRLDIQEPKDFTDNKSGVINVIKNLKGHRAIARSRYLSQFETLPVTVDLVIEKGSF